MKNLPLYRKSIYLQTSPTEKYRKYSQSPKSTPQLSFTRSHHTGNYGNHHKQMSMISNLKNQLGSIRNQVSKLIEKSKSPRKNSEIEVIETPKNKDEQDVISKRNEEVFYKNNNPENDQEMQKLSKSLIMMKTQLKEALERQSLIISEKFEILGKMDILIMDKKQTQIKLHEAQMKIQNFQQLTESVKKKLSEVILENQAMARKIEESQNLAKQYLQKIKEKQFINKILAQQKQVIQKDLLQSYGSLQKEKQRNKINQAKISVFDKKYEKIKEEKKFLKLREGNIDKNLLQNADLQRNLKSMLKQKEDQIILLKNDVEFLEEDVKSLLNWRYHSDLVNQINESLTSEIFKLKIEKLNSKYISNEK